MAFSKKFMIKVYNVKIPLIVEIRKINNYKVKDEKALAVAKLSYAGLIIDDVYIIKHNDRQSVVYPAKYIKNKESSIIFPCIPNLSKQFNYAILQAYRESLFSV